MKAAVVEKKGVLKVKEVPMPPVGDYDVLCELLYGATCSGTDSHLIAGRLPFFTNYPGILGHESIGRVIQTGPRVVSFRKGDLVTRVGAPPMPEAGIDVCWGGFAEYGIARDHFQMRKDGIDKAQWNGYRVNQLIPLDFNPQTAALIITWRETLSYINRMGLEKASRILICGSGGNALAFAAHAKNAGLKDIVMIGSRKRQKNAELAGVTHYYDYKNEDYSDRINSRFPEGLDFIIDVIGKKGIANALLGFLSKGGTIGIYGVDEFGADQIDPFLAPRGSFACNNNFYDEEDVHEEVIELIRKNKLNPDIWLDDRYVFDLENINDAFDAVRQRECVKALIKCF